MTEPNAPEAPKDQPATANPEFLAASETPEGSASGGASSSGASAALTEANSADGKLKAPRAKLAVKDQPLLFWVIGIVALFCLELYIYGRNGRVQVCVGLEGVTDFALIGEVRTPDNVRQFPYCSERLNLGMYGSSEEAAKVSLTEACNRASALTGADRLDCLRRENGWLRKVNREQVPPWDPRLFRRLLWLD